MTVAAGTFPEVVRPRYSEGQFLSAADFEAEQAYHRRSLGRHQVGEHTWGLVVGLDLVEVADADGSGFVDAYLTPGLAVDGFGRQICSFLRVPVDVALFDAFTDQAHRTVWIELDELASRPPPEGFADCREGMPTRSVESFRLVVDPVDPTNDVVVDGLVAVAEPAPGATMPADTSVPSQELPQEPPLARWLLRLGTLRWDGGARRFRPAGQRLGEGRRYAGVVAADVLAPSASLRLAPRTAPADPDAADFARLDGRLRVQGRVNAERELWMEGRPIRFTGAAGAGEPQFPLTLGRDSGPGLPHRLRLTLGAAPSAELALSIGTEADVGAPNPVAEVRADGRMRLPLGPLDLGAVSHREKLELHGPSSGIGTQPGVVYLRSPGSFAWFAGGEHSDTALNPGQGGTLRLVLDDTGALQFGIQTQQMLNLWSTGYGIGVQSLTLYSRSFSDFCWFRGGVHADGRSDPGGGTLAMRLDSQSTLQVFGPATVSGALTVGAGGDAPLVTRHVRGKGSGTDAPDHLYLQWDTGRNVVVGGGGQSSVLDVNGALSVRQAGLGAVQSVVKAVSYQLTVVNAFAGTTGLPSVWDCPFGGDLDEVYTVFAVVSGFSVVGTTLVGTPSRSASVDVIPQEVWVKVSGFSNVHAWGTAFCGQSKATMEDNNATLVTVVAIGRKLP